MKKAVIYMACVLTAVSVTAGCAGRPKQETNRAADEDTQRDTDASALKAGDFVTVLKVDTDKSAIDVKRVAGGNKYTLSYTGTTQITDKYDRTVSALQIEPGELADIVYSAHSKTLLQLGISKDAWVNSGVDKFDLNQARKTIEIGEDRYKFNDNLTIISQGEETELIDLNSQDVLTLKGTGKTVHSIVVERGHGYIRMQNEEQFLGGFVEVGQSIILPVTEDMLITAPEGEYDLRISKGRFGGSTPVTVTRNEETLIDVGELYDGVLKTGDIAFLITPSGAKLYIDGEEQDYAELISLPYGIHQIMLKADDYVTMTKFINVGQPLASIEIEMEKTEEVKEREEKEKEASTSGSNGQTSGTGSSSSAGQTASSTSLFHPETNSRYKPPTYRRYNNTTSAKRPSSSSASSGSGAGGNSSTEIISPSSQNKIYVDGPSGAEVYFDNQYVGVAPVSFKKETGSHTVSLRMTGFETKSYTVDIDDSTGDVTYSFSPLIGTGD